MAYSLLYGERPTLAAAESRTGFFATVASWIAKARARHSQRVALSNLLEFDAALLADLGINRDDVLEALQHSDAAAGRVLAARRAQSAHDWLSHP
jgi:uncharacterized protein YjiS (DUF1127 family)